MPRAPFKKVIQELLLRILLRRSIEKLLRSMPFLSSVQVMGTRGFIKLVTLWNEECIAIERENL